MRERGRVVESSRGAGRWPVSDPAMKLRLVDGEHGATLVEDGEGGMAVMVKQSCRVEKDG
jgi:hypothetical protein